MAFEQRTCVIGYGERGVINALVQSLNDVNRVGRFLRAIRWAGGLRPQWIDEIKHVTFIVEIWLSDFGDPDLIIVCTDNAGQRHYVFLEAKVVPYEASAVKNSIGMVTGYNSSINGQITLKYRFCRALENWDSKSDQLVEPHDLWLRYQEKMKDKNNEPRKLSKFTILNKILKPLDFHKLSLDRSYFVALTWDSDPGPFSEMSRISNLLPLFLSENGEDLWDKMRDRVGWLGYGILDKELDLNGGFHQALFTMVPHPEPPSIQEGFKETIPISNRWDAFSELTNSIADDMFHMLSRHFGSGSTERLKGSISTKVGGKTLIKIIPRRKNGKDTVLLGLSIHWSGLQSLAKLRFNGPYNIVGQPFMVYEFLPERWKDIKPHMEALFESLTEL